MSKRKLDEYLNTDTDFTENAEKIPKQTHEHVNKHSLDSDEEDDNPEDTYDILHEDDIEGQEDGDAGMDGEVRITAFNMKEEMEEGHFDTQGHFLWKKEKQIKDSWLDSIDWQKIHKVKDGENVPKNSDKGLGEESDSDDEVKSSVDTITLYKRIVEFLKPGETVARALKRLGSANKALSSAERLKRKKAGIVDSATKDITELTEHANQLLTLTGNMDIYQETYEQIWKTIKAAEKKSTSSEVDMYADDFEEKEKIKMEGPTTSNELTDTPECSSSEVQWEFKWAQDATEVYGPHSAQQMQFWVAEGYFKDGVWVRKVGQEGPFYTSTRIDFELYF